jgi:DNA topoisomerase-1
VTDFLVKTLPDLFNVEFTREMEEELDLVEEGKVEWTSMMRRFYDDFIKWLGEAKMHGAPEKNSAARLLELFSKVSFPPPPETAGKRRAPKTDGSFFESLRKAFDEKGGMSARQYAALCNLAAKYADQVPELAEFAPEVDEKSAEMQQKAAAVDWSPVFAALDKVEIPSVPAKGGRRVFDARKFYESFKKQYASGRALSEKQLGVLRRIVSDLQEKIPEPTAVLALFDNVLPPVENSKKQTAAPATAGEPAQQDAGKDDLDFLASVTQWDDPVKKGRRVYDDREFYNSIAQQKAKGRSLSGKQLAALAKLAAKYRDKVTQQTAQ